MKHYTIGIDFGSLSGRAVIMDVESGEVCASSVYEYPHGVMSEQLPDGTPLPVHTALQDPHDYIEVLRYTIPESLQKAGISPDAVVGLGIDFTACTMLPLDSDMHPLCEHEAYRSEPHAYVKLWKHHAAQPDADLLNRVAKEKGEPWLQSYGGRISSEWMFPKILQIAREAPAVYQSTARFMEAADWISFVLTGQETHSAPFAGYKALWNELDGYPSNSFFEAVDPQFENLIGTKFSDQVHAIGASAGVLCADAAEMTGLPVGISVSIPQLDAHASMPALGIAQEGVLMMIIGTSGVQLVHSKEKKTVSGICGYMKDGVIPGLYTYEAGQACCGDHFDWFVKNGVPAAYRDDATKQGMGIHQYLRQKAQALRPGESGLIALDWFNGNRSVLNDGSLQGGIIGMTLRTKPEEIYRALIEGTAYGARMILENFVKNGIRVDRIVASGGIAEKDEMLIQIYADVLNRPITVSDSRMSASCGSAIYASVAAGIYPDIVSAVDALSVRTGKSYLPIPKNVALYNRLYEEYQILHDYFGKGGNDVMKRLEAIRKSNEIGIF